MRQPSRREFLKSSLTTACAAGLTRAAMGHTANLSPSALAVKKGLVFTMLPEELSYADRFKLARDTGFEIVQAPTEPEGRKAEEIKKAADSAGIRIDSVMNMDHWKYPLSSSDHEVVDKSLAGMRTSLHNAKLGDRTRFCSCQP
jgi:hexulose-6-phosphate isomerase